VDLRVQNSRMVVKMNQPCGLLATVADRGQKPIQKKLTIRNKPKELSNIEVLPLSALTRADSMLKPPGVKTIAKEIQKPP
jgi:hypothetical protein